MSEKTKIILGIVIGVLVAVALFSLIVVISCSVNGLTFGKQVCDWFGSSNISTTNISSSIPVIA